MKATNNKNMSEIQAPSAIEAHRQPPAHLTQEVGALAVVSNYSDRGLDDPFSPGWRPEAHKEATESPESFDNKTPGELAEKALGESLNDKTNEALETSIFSGGPEFRKGLHDFYEAHYAMAGVAEMTLADLPKDAAEQAGQEATLRQVVDSSIFSAERNTSNLNLLVRSNRIEAKDVQTIAPLLAAVRIARFNEPDNPQLARAEMTAQLYATQHLFDEVGIGVTTLGEKEQATVDGLHEKVTQKMRESGLFTYYPGGEGYGDTYRPLDAHNGFVVDQLSGGAKTPVTYAQEKFWGETRHAGQLLYHNTSFLNDVYKNGSLQTRRMQTQQQGHFNASTLASAGGATIHTPMVHWSEFFDPQGYRDPNNGGTLAMPMTEVIKTTPYGRNSEYGTVWLKPGAAIDHNVTVHDTLGELKDGSPDGIGQSGIDRSFYSSPLDVAPSKSLDEAPDGYAYQWGNHTYRITMGEKEFERTNMMGAGENMPIPRHFDTTGDRFDGRNDHPLIAEQVKKLQQENLDKYSGQLVVPLRSGVMNFSLADGGKNIGRDFAQFNRIVA
jgi:hypothetical protein